MNTVERVILLGIGALAALSMVARNVIDSANEIPKAIKPSVDVFCTYSDLIEALTKADLYETTKCILLDRIPAGACGDYYRSVIAVIEGAKKGNNTFIVSQVEKITRTFGYKI